MLIHLALMCDGKYTLTEENPSNEAGMTPIKLRAPWGINSGSCARQIEYKHKPQF